MTETYLGIAFYYLKRVCLFVCLLLNLFVCLGVNGMSMTESPI